MPTPATTPNSGTGSQASPQAARRDPAGPDPLVQATWPIRTREHVDLWLHSYALLTRDTTLVPYFRRDYRTRINEVRQKKNAASLIDTDRAKLLARIAVEPSILTAGQFLPLYFSNWTEMKQAIEVFVRNDGNPGSISDPATRQYFAILGGAFSSAADREWLRLFTAAADDESKRFYHDYWMAESRAHSVAQGHIDTLWQKTWRPALQRFLNNTQQQNGELYLSLPLGGEGRTVQFGKAQNAIAIEFPDSPADAEAALYVIAHEIAGPIASQALADNTTPADQRTGANSRYEQAAAVRAGALLLQRTVPGAVFGYMRFYLQAAGYPVPNDPQAAFNSVFGLPTPVRDAIVRQLEVVLGGI